MSLYICNNCGYGSASWIGRCPDCGQWNTFTATETGEKKKQKTTLKFEVKKLSDIKPLSGSRKKTGIFEFDRVLGGGFIEGEVILLTGEPGVGKSTLLLQSLTGLKTLYVSGEEAAEQVRERAERLKVNLDNFSFSQTTQIESIIEGVDQLKSKIEVLVIDSIQTIYSNAIDSSMGSTAQLKETVSRLISHAKKNKLIIIIVGHITKEGEIAGPKALEHLVDCVIAFEGERISHHRLLRATKNRFGPTDEIGIFEMRQGGLVQVNDPLAFLEDKSETSIGKAIVGINEGKRPLFFEIQTLASPTVLAVPRRVVKGLDYNKVLLLLAVIRKYLAIPLDRFDIYVNVIGGVNVKTPASDLGLVASVISSFKNIPLPRNSLFIGEVGLLGEIRKTYFEEKIVVEARRLGFKKIYSSSSLKKITDLRNL